MTPPNLDSTDIPEKFDDALAELRQLMQVLEGEDISIDTLQCTSVHRRLDAVRVLPR